MREVRSEGKGEIETNVLRTAQLPEEQVNGCDLVLPGVTGCFAT